MITDENKIYDLIDKATEMNGTYPGMSYEDGIKAALEWVLGEGEDPLEE